MSSELGSSSPTSPDANGPVPLGSGSIDLDASAVAGDALPGQGGQPSAGLRLIGTHRHQRPTRLQPDIGQQRVIDLAVGSGPVVVVGGPGTGKTTTVVEAVAARVRRDGLLPSALLVLAPTRLAAAALRDRITRRITESGAAALLEPPVRTAASYAFSLVRRHAVLAGEPTPRLISGPEQDVILADLLAGHAVGDGLLPHWPEEVAEALSLKGFRHELRDLLMRAMERGIGPRELARLAQTHRRPVWRAAAVVYREYLEVTALATPGAFDPAAIVDHAAALLAENSELLAAERARLRLVAVDDHHESSEAVARLLDQLCPPGADLLLVGDPDATTQSFRGAQPQLLGDAPERYTCRDGSLAPVFTLGRGWRFGGSIAELAGRVAARIGALGPQPAVRRSASPAAEADSPGQPDLGRQVEVAVLRSMPAQAARAAAELRRAHLVHGLAWSRLAVIARDASQLAGLRRGLAQAGVPIGFTAAEQALRDEPAIRPLLSATRVLLEESLLDEPDTLTELLQGVGGADSMAVRRLRQQLARAAQSAADGEPSEDGLPRSVAQLLRAAVDDPDELAAAVAIELPEPVRRVAAVLRAGRSALRDPGATAESLLWAVWQASDLAERWQSLALAGGPAGRRADRDLDAVVALFEAAARFADRLPGAGATEFLMRLDAQDLPEDTLAAHAPSEEFVTVSTPQAVAGREFDLVVVAGLQDGVWPNTRLRSSLLGATTLVDIAAGRFDGFGRDDPQALRAARTQVLHDELRMLYVAVTRARRRLLVTAVSNADTVPSPFLDLIDPQVGPEPRPVLPGTRPVSLAGAVARLRGALLDPAAEERVRGEAAAQLHRLATEAVPAAHPRDWYGWAGLSDADALSAGGGPPVRVSPSAVEKFADCPLRWLLDRSGGTPPAPATVAVGTLVHEIAQHFPDAPAADLRDELQRRWPEIGLPAGWVGERLLARAEGMMERLVSYRRHDQGDVAGREIDFRVQIGEAVLAGRIDQLEVTPDGRLVAVDLKTGRSPKSDKAVQRNPQLGAYQLAVEAGAFRSIDSQADSAGARLVQLGQERASGVRVQQQRSLTSDDDPGWARELIERVAVGMGGAGFAATVNEGCRHCPVRSSCPAHAEGRQVGE